MKVKSEVLISDLIERTRQTLNQAEALHKRSLEQLNWRPAPKSWSILECLEHLNLYGDFYLPEIDRRIQQSTKLPSPIFKSGLLGNYFAKTMLPKEPLNKMNTFADKNPLGSTLDQTTIERFIGQQQRTLSLLDQARTVNLNRVKTAITIKFFKLKLGDTFRVVVYHNERHMVQVKQVLEAYDMSLSKV